MRIFTNTAVTLDGRIGNTRYDTIFVGTHVDRWYMSVLRARADAILVGGRTFRAGPIPMVPNPKAQQALRDVGFFDTDMPPIEGRQWWNVVVTRTLDVPLTGRFYDDPRVRPLFLSSTFAETGTEIEVTPEVTVPWIVEQLEKRGVQNLLLEAGGDLLYQFLAAGVVDEIYATVCPGILGGRGAPSLVDGEGFMDVQRLELLHAQVFGEEIYCRYRVKR